MITTKVDLRIHSYYPHIKVKFDLKRCRVSEMFLGAYEKERKDNLCCSEGTARCEVGYLAISNVSRHLCVGN